VFFVFLLHLLVQLWLLIAVHVAEHRERKRSPGLRQHRVSTRTSSVIVISQRKENTVFEMFCCNMRHIFKVIRSNRPEIETLRFSSVQSKKQRTTSSLIAKLLLCYRKYRSLNLVAMPTFSPEARKWQFLRMCRTNMAKNSQEGLV